MFLCMVYLDREFASVSNSSISADPYEPVACGLACNE